MGPKQPSHTTQTTEVKLPEWVDKASQENYEFAKDIASKPLVQYGGPTVAPISQGTKDAWNLFYSNIGAGDSNYNTVNKALKGILGANTPLVNTDFDVDDVNTDFNAQQITADQVKAGKFTDLDLDAYMNPFITNVEEKALGALNDQRVQALMQNADKAVASKAFGGSRSAIVDAVTNAEAAKSAGLLSADLRKQGFDAAANLATLDLNRLLQGDLANQAANLTAGQANQQANLAAQELASNAEKTNQAVALELQKLGFSAEQANQLAELQMNQQKQGAADSLIGSTESQNKQNLQDFAGLLGIGTTQQQHAQDLINAQMAKFYEARDYDTDRLNLLLSSLGMSPYGKAENVDKQVQGGSAGTDWAMMGMGFLQMLPFLAGLSDEREKTDKKKIGKDPLTGLDLYAFRYKGDPKTYPKMVGPMAQDIEEMFPDMVFEVGGRKVVKGLLGA